MTLPIVNTFNGWDPLEEIIVGVVDGSARASNEICIEAIVPEALRPRFNRNSRVAGGEPRVVSEANEMELAKKDLAEFIHILEAEGVKVRRPDPIDWAKPYTTPFWTSPGGRAQTCPRDSLLVVGNEIIEAPMSWRSQYFETMAYRTILKEYFQAGAKWTAAPKSTMKSELYDYDYAAKKGWVSTEYEPIWDAADVARVGKDLFVQRSHVTNESGIEWLRRHLGETYRVHRVEFHDDRAHHIDATFVPLAPGKLLVNPDRPIKQMPDVFKKGGWEFLTCPPTTYRKDLPRFELNKWLHMNMLSLDEQRIFVEKEEEPLIKALKDWGFKPIPCSFRNFYDYGGSFHCATLDTRRRGALQSYF